MCESYFQVRSLHSFSESLPLQKSSPLSHLILSHCDGTISKPKSIHSYSFTPRSVPAVPKKAIKINSDSKKKKSALTMQFPSKTCGQCLECH